MSGKQIKTKIETREFAIDGLEEAKYNPRFMPTDHAKGLDEAIEELGVLRLPVVNVRDKGKPRLVGGHQLVKQLKARGFTHVECAVVRLDDTAERAANLSLNNPATQGTFDPAALAALERLRTKLPDPNRACFEDQLATVREAAARWKAANAKQAEDGDTPDAAEDIDSKLGVTYALGEHLLYCGDFREALPALLPEHYAHACITDPPYNIAYTSGKKHRKDKLREPIEGDDESPEEWGKFVGEMADQLLASVRGPMYVFMSAQELPSLEAAWKKHKGVVERWLVLAKNAHPLSPGDYHPQYELCLYGAHKEVGDLPWYGKAAMTNVIPTVRPSRNPLHPMQKPVELIRTLMFNSTDVEEVVIDPFAGSGTTLVVAEELARVCYAAELSPGHCDTIRRRWASQVHGREADWKALTPVHAD